MSRSEDVLKQLVDYEVIILMDDSGSMEGSLWKQAKSVMKKVVEKASQYDRNGIEIRFLNTTEWGVVKTKKETKQLFKGIYPRGSTPLGRCLGAICRDYLTKLETPPPQGLKRCLIIAITDGAPDINDKPLVYSTIKDTARELDRLGAPLAQLGIQFVQIGHDLTATAFLNELDDNLKGDTASKVERDIVDTVPYSGAKLTSEDMVKILAGAINRKVDNQTITGR